MPYCITLRSRTDALITGWYDGSDSRWSTDRNRQKVFNKKSDVRPVCHELRSLWPQNAEVINIEADPYRFVLERSVEATPGTAWNYNGGGVWLLGLLLRKVSGQPLDGFAKDALFEPLGLRNGSG